MDGFDDVIVGMAWDFGSTGRQILYGMAVVEAKLICGANVNTKARRTPWAWTKMIRRQLAMMMRRGIDKEVEEDPTIVLRSGEWLGTHTRAILWNTSFWDGRASAHIIERILEPPVQYDLCDINVGLDVPVPLGF